MHPDQLIAIVAREQDDVIALCQLRALDIGRGAVRSRVNRGVLDALHSGVYHWGATGDAAPRTRARGAAIACKGDGLVGVHAAAGLWEMRPHPAGPIDVTVIGRRVRVDGLRTHPVDRLDRRDARLLHGIPVTAPARTLYDLASALSPADLADAVERAQVKRLVTLADIESTIRRAPRRPGAQALRAIIETPGFTRSRAERIVRDLLRAAELPLPQFNTYANGFEVDALWAAQRVILEYDSYTFHATRAAFERDRARDAAHTRAGYLVLRTTWHELTQRPYVLVARIAEALAARRRAA